jgi:hypothetical protein
MLSHGHRLLAELRKHGGAIAHHIPGRVRLKVPLAHGNPTTLRQMKDTFDKMPGVKASEIRSSSASLVLYYDQNDPGALLASDVAPWGRPTVGIGEARQIADGALKHVFTALDRNGWQVPGSNKIPSLRNRIPIGLAAATFLEICVAAAPPLWLSLALLFLKHVVDLRPRRGEAPTME